MFKDKRTIIVGLDGVLFGLLKDIFGRCKIFEKRI